MAKKTARRRGNVTTVDFTGVQAGGLSLPDGRYAAKIIGMERRVGSDSDEPYVQLEWEITSESCNGRSIKFDNHSLQPQALPFLRALLEAIEYPIEDSGDTDIDWDQIIKDEMECIVETVAVPSRDDPTKKYARIVGYYPLSDGGTVDDEKDEPKDKRRRPAKEEEEPEEDDRPPRRARKDEEEDDRPPRRARKDDEPEEEPERPSSRKIKKGARVKFKDEKGRPTKGTIEKIDGDEATVVSDNEDTYVIDIDELTVIG